MKLEDKLILEQALTQCKTTVKLAIKHFSGLMFLVFLGYFAILPAQAQNAKAFYLFGEQNQAGPIRLNDYLEVLPDEKGLLTLKDILSDNYQAKFKKTQDLASNTKYHWARIYFKNTQKQSVRWVFNILPFDEVTLFMPTQSGEFKQVKNGLHVPKEDISILYSPHSLLIEEVPISESIQVLYIRIKTDLYECGCPPVLKAYLTQNDQMLKNREELLHVAIAFQSVLWVMVIYNLFLWFFIKDRAYLYYILTMASLSFYFLLMDNFIYYWLGTAFRTQSKEFKFLITLLITLSCIFFINFTRHYFQTFQRAKPWDNAFKLLIILFILDALINMIALGYHQYYPMVSNILVLLMIVFVLFFTSYATFYKKYPSGQYYFWANITLFVFLFIYVLYLQDIIPYSTFAENSFKVGFISQLLGFSIALAGRINVFKQEIAQEKAENERLEKEKIIAIHRLTEEKNRELEQKVAERTLELSKVNEELNASNEALQGSLEIIKEEKQKSEELNHIKDRLFSIISHDLRSPLAQLEGVLSLSETGYLSHEELQYMLPEINKNIRYTSELTNNLLQWAKNQLEGITYEPSHFDLFEIANNKVYLFEVIAKKKGIAINNRIQKKTIVFGDKNMIDLVIRNLVSNAIKFCRKGDNIIIDAQKEDAFCKITIQDTGVGIPSEHIGKLFDNENFSTRGTQNEKGTGLGLILCKEFIEKNKGKIWVESIENEGSSFYFTIPLEEELVEK